MPPAPLELWSQSPAFGNPNMQYTNIHLGLRGWAERWDPYLQGMVHEYVFRHFANPKAVTSDSRDLPPQETTTDEEEAEPLIVPK